MNAGPPSLAPTSFSGVLPAPAAIENAGSSTDYRSYDRAAKVGVPGGGNTLFAYQNDRIFGLTAPPVWTLLHSITGQHAGFGLGAHTGLYLVDARDGSGAYLVGLFRAAAGGFGFVKLNLTTGVWSDGTNTALLGAAGGMSSCMSYQGQLAHAGRGWLTFFDPLTDTFSQVEIDAAFDGSTDPWVKLRVSRGRLFLIGRGDTGASSAVYICEYVFGGVTQLAIAPTVMDVTGTSEGFLYPVFIDTIWIGYEQPVAAVGGKGFRMWQYNVTSDVPGTALPAPSDLVAQVDTFLAPPVGVSESSEIHIWGDNGHTALAGAGPSVQGYSYNDQSLTSLFDLFGALGLDGLPFTRRTIAPFPDGEYSRHSSPNGTSEHLAPNAFPQIESMERFSDGTVARGILIKFRMHTAGGSFPQVRFLYGSELRSSDHAQATLSVGDGITIGGTMAIDAPNKWIDTSSPIEAGATLYQIVWDLDADSIPVDEWLIIRPVGFFSGFESAGLLNPGTAHSVNALLGSPLTANPTETGGPVDEGTALSSGNPTETGGPVDEGTALSSANPATTGGPVDEATGDTDLTGSDLSRPAAGGRPYTRGGGTVGVEIDGGGSVGDRQEINWESQGPGLTLEPLPGLPLGPLVGFRVDGVIELGRATVDAVLDAADTTYPILDVDALGLSNVGPLKVIARLIAQTGVSVQPTLALGTNGASFDNQAATQALSLTVADTVEDLTMQSPSVEAGAGDVVTLRLVGQATATTYQVEVIVYGYHRRI